MPKLWRFDILVDDALMHFNPDRTNICPDENNRLLSVVNGFEDGNWMKKNFQDFIFNNVALTALTASERAKIVDEQYTTLTEAAKHLRLIEDKGKGSEIAEIVLYGIMKHHFGALSVVPKIFYKQNDNDNAKGADSVHIVIDGAGNFELWLGEAKFYSDIEDDRFYEPLKSVAQMLSTPILKKEIGVMTSLNELDDQIDDKDLVARIKDALSGGVSIDDIKPLIHVPILLLHQCDITSGATVLDDAYKKAIVRHHEERAVSYFTKQINKLGGIPNYTKIQFHLILFPVPNKENIVNWFVERAQKLKEDANG